MNNKECAKMFCDAIRTMGNKPQNIDNLESYLTRHFVVWHKVHAGDPEQLATEMKTFAEMKID